MAKRSDSFLSSLPSPSSEWKKSFQNHILVFEKFLLDTKSELPGEQTVYLAGMLTRQSNSSYLRQIRRFLLRSPEELDTLTRKHYLCIGQNAPVYFISRINAEYITVKLVSKKAKQGYTNWEKLIPIRYFEVASIYAYQAGNRTLGSIMSYIYKNYHSILSLLSVYMEFLKENQPSPNDPIQKPLWQRFAQVHNERNNKKEYWEAHGLSEKHKTHIHRHEFNQMINFSSKN